MSRILLADDSPQALRLAEQILRRDGVEVVSVTDGAVALRRLADVNPDVLITDVYLPTQNAFELARFVRAQPEYSYLKIVFAAAPADEFNEQDARNAGADAILRKPFEASTLLSTVSRLAEESKAAREKSPGAQPALDRATIRAAVTLAIDRAMPMLIEELTERVTVALAHSLGRRKSTAQEAS